MLGVALQKHRSKKWKKEGLATSCCLAESLCHEKPVPLNGACRLTRDLGLSLNFWSICNKPKKHQKISKSNSLNSLNSLNQFWPLNLLCFSAISTKILMHVDVIIKDLLHILGQKLCPCKLPQRAFVLSLDEQKYCMWTHCSVRSWVIKHAFFTWKTVISTQKLVDISKQSWGSLWLVFALRLVDCKDTSEHRWVRFCYKAAIVCHLQPQRRFPRTDENEGGKACNLVKSHITYLTWWALWLWFTEQATDLRSWRSANGFCRPLSAAFTA